MTTALLLAIVCILPGPEVHFSPGGGCTAELVRCLDAAHREVRVLAYSFTSAPIAAALVRAHARGVDVQVIADDGQRTATGNRLGVLVAGGVPVSLDGAHAIAHNKVVVIDRELVVTGSFNYSAAAERSNAENLVTLHDRPLAARYLADWSKHAGHALPLTLSP